MGALGTFLRKGFVVEFARRVRIEREVELVLPAELESGFAQGVVPDLGAWMAFGQVGGVGRNLVGDDPVFDVLFVGEP